MGWHIVQREMSANTIHGWGSQLQTEKAKRRPVKKASAATAGVSMENVMRVLGFTDAQKSQ